jgi:hypothetical protein
MYWIFFVAIVAIASAIVLAVIDWNRVRKLVLVAAFCVASNGALVCTAGADHGIQNCPALDSIIDG